MDRYAFGPKIGRGAFGEVYRATSRNTGKQVAIKKVGVAALSETERKKAPSEAKILKTLKHCNIVAYQDALEDKGHLYIVMEYCDGGDLHSHLAQRNNDLLPEEEILKMFVHICVAVEYIHRKKILHRDIKPHNIFMTSNGILKLGDFGISKELNSSLDMAKTLAGTPCYASPEIWRSVKYNNKSDIWSFGCVLHEMMTLKPAFQEKNRRLLVKKITRGDHAPLPQKYSKDMQNLVERMLKPDASKRPSAETIRTTPVIQLQIYKHLSELKGNVDGEHVQLSSVLRNALVPSNAADVRTGSTTPNALASVVIRTRPIPSLQRPAPKSPYESKLRRQRHLAACSFLSLKCQEPPKRRSPDNRQQHRLANVNVRPAKGQALTLTLEKRCWDDPGNMKLNAGKRRPHLQRSARSLPSDTRASPSGSPEKPKTLRKVHAHSAPVSSSNSNGSSIQPVELAAACGEDTAACSSQNQDVGSRTRVLVTVRDGLSAGIYDICNSKLLRTISLPSLMTAGSTNKVLGKARSAADLSCGEAIADMVLEDLQLNHEGLDEVTTDVRHRCGRSTDGNCGNAEHFDGCDADSPRDTGASSNDDSEANDQDEISAVLERRSALERELGASILNWSYGVIQRVFEDDNGDMEDCRRIVEQSLPPDRVHLYEKLLELVIADIAFSLEDERQGQRPEATAAAALVANAEADDDVNDLDLKV